MPKKVLFVRSGGGLPGLDIHAGIWLAMEQAGITATECWGTSAGALISAFDASLASARISAGIIRELSDREIRRPRAFWKCRVPWIDSYLDPAPIRARLDRLLPAWDGLVKGFECYATDTADGIAVGLHHTCRGQCTLQDAVQASMAISGVFPPVRIGPREYADGGVSRNLPAPKFHTEAWDEIWLIVASGDPDTYQRHGGMLTRLVQNVRWMMQAQIRDAIADCLLAAESYGRRGNVRVIWPDLPTPRGALHFDHDLIDRARDYTASLLETLSLGEPKPTGEPK